MNIVAALMIVACTIPGMDFKLVAKLNAQKNGPNVQASGQAVVRDQGKVYRSPINYYYRLWAYPMSAYTYKLPNGQVASFGDQGEHSLYHRSMKCNVDMKPVAQRRSASPTPSPTPFDPIFGGHDEFCKHCADMGWGEWGCLKICHP